LEGLAPQAGRLGQFAEVRQLLGRATARDGVLATPDARLRLGRLLIEFA
jgi:hypothetical protein